MLCNWLSEFLKKLDFCPDNPESSSSVFAEENVFMLRFYSYCCMVTACIYAHISLNYVAPYNMEYFRHLYFVLYFLFRLFCQLMASNDIFATVCFHFSESCEVKPFVLFLFQVEGGWVICRPYPFWSESSPFLP